VVTAQSTASRTVATKIGLDLPATLDQRTDLNLFITAVAVFYVRNERKVSYAVLEQVMDAVRDSGAIVVLYVGADGGQDARVLWPTSITLTADNNLTCKAYCTMRRAWKSFRIDRMLTCHPLTTPDDITID